jgi:fructose-1-phosphate kinase PfkB-like protein
MTRQPPAAELLKTPGALLTRSHLQELGLGRTAIDAVFRELDVVVFPGSTRPHVKRDDYLELVARATYDDQRVRLTRR